jgi:predicted metal-binding membrane protein
MQETSVLEAVIQRDRAIVITGLLVVIALAWTYILMGAGMGMTAFKMSSGNLPWQSSSEMAMPSHQSRPGAMPGQDGGR